MMENEFSACRENSTIILLEVSSNVKLYTYSEIYFNGQISGYYFFTNLQQK